jgi:hypothetical protein
MTRVARAIEAPSIPTGLKEHPIPRRLGGSIRHAMLDHVNVDSWAESFRDGLSARSLDDLADGEVDLIRMLPVQQRGGDPYLIGDLEQVYGSGLHTNGLHITSANCSQASRPALFLAPMAVATSPPIGGADGRADELKVDDVPYVSRQRRLAALPRLLASASADRESDASKAMMRSSHTRRALASPLATTRN